MVTNMFKNYNFSWFGLRKMAGKVGELIKGTVWGLGDYVCFMVLLGLFLINKILIFICQARLTKDLCRKIGFGYVEKIISVSMERIGKVKPGRVSKLYIIELSLKNMRAKKIRSLVTVGGVALGVGAIVFLVSLGYGLERMVIGQVARLDELKMIDINTSGSSTKIKLNDDLIKKLANIGGVGKVVPMVSIVSKIKFNNSISDVMSFGVDEKYLEAAGVKMLYGNNLKDENINLSFFEMGEVEGIAQTKVKGLKGEQIFGGVFQFNLVEGKKALARSGCGDDFDALGLVVRSEGMMVGEAIWSDRYFEEKEEVVGIDEQTGQELSIWVKAKMPLWTEDENENIKPMLNKDGQQIWEVACLKGNEVMVDRGEEWKFLDLVSFLKSDKTNGLVLGISDEATGSADLNLMSSEVASAGAEPIYDVVVETDESGNEWVELKKPGEDVETEKIINFFGKPSAKAFVSRNLTKLFGLSEEEALGKVFKVSFLVSDSLIPGLMAKGQSEEIDFVIDGVVDDDQSNYFYFMLSDAKRLGVKNYSQLKIVVDKQELVTGVRQEIETLGLKTASTLDTVAEIEKLFRNIRFLLGLLGTVALAVASLGMFNTMTVSLLERTREVGVMKAMGMLSIEVKDLFLTESMIMGVGGGVAGIVFGFGLGKLVSLILTSVSVFKGQGLIDISYVPLFFIVFILIVSIVVGVATGWYPSKRARDISALNALRYE